jgi:hypothetical protein
MEGSFRVGREGMAGLPGQFTEGSAMNKVAGQKEKGGGQ